MTLSVKDVAERYGVSLHTVLAWIRNGELAPVNVGRRLGAGKPRWRITQSALAAFEALRTPSPPTPKTRRRRRPAEVLEFIK